MKTVSIDLLPSRNREELHAYLAESLQLPSYYGANLDALFDCLTDTDTDTEIRITGSGITSDPYEKSLLDVFRDAAAQNRHLRVIFGDPEQEATKRASRCVSSLSGKLGRPLYACVVTFGCQMNARDSEKIRGVLDRIGYRMTEAEEDADFVLYNTCTVRENANTRVYGRLGSLLGRKKTKPHMIVALCGCMMQEKGEADYVREHYPFVDLIFGTFNLKSLTELIASALEADAPVIDIREKMEELPENMPTLRKYPFKSGVNITYGCNNFCSYCIVPYVRGREISRMPQDILEEIRALAADGVREVMLLGQNVNSYGNTLGKEVTFANLLREIVKIDGIERIRFMTSHPKDFSDELIEVIAENEKICRHIHLPAQSGSTAILKKMNRRYTRKGYLDLVARIRKAIPDISLTTDIIVGFPGETERNFSDTLRLIDEVGYDSVFTFIYSKRTGTPAAAMEDQVPEEVVKERFDRLLALVHEKASAACSRFEGQTLPVLVEEKNRSEGLLTGRLGSNLLVHFPGPPELIGQIVPVFLKECKGFYYLGEISEER
ncbi:MAG: tRNA (N6-isopentenyl adenosine(37)-C2)-methylthiotransferase MiaB [Lachnospiraceae bacterium]|nr:tRNA (N6-isopentenyl adenosine(37)-C2)-methylthiotransferase MiaB [Lachnospiraceae bacterium]